MYPAFQKVIHHLIREPSLFSGFRQQFDPQDRAPLSIPRNLNAAFLIILSDSGLSHLAKGYLVSMESDSLWGAVASTYLETLEAIETEISRSGADNLWLAKSMDDLMDHLVSRPDMSDPGTMERFHRVFFPEAVGLEEEGSGGREEAVLALRKKRWISIKQLNPSPVSEPHREVLFTSNVLLTLPLNEEHFASLSPDLRNRLEAVSVEEQRHWYDHPTPVGVDRNSNETIYGLGGLDEAVRFEIGRGSAPADARVQVLLSVSTTHEGLQEVARGYLGGELSACGVFDHLDIYAVTESDVSDLLDQVLLPASVHLFPGRDTGPLVEVLGVEGEYGRHYSFLKAAAALWNVLVDDRIRATFKFDLDQVFPQQLLVDETGRSAFEHLADPLWGAIGTDDEGRAVELGMLAGALVNEEDVGKGLFTPDVKWHQGSLTGEQWIFASALPQALSTEVEMMARYGEGDVDGVTSCLQRVHVTGGTTGILVDALKRHRPFTPTWIGRAEDQAYIMSVLFPEERPPLRYFHASGFIMRHDKEVFAADAMDAARTGKAVGDLVRVLAFSAYAAALPWGVSRIKSFLDPFTGCFISRLPLTVAWLRLALKAAAWFMEGGQEGSEEGNELVRMGSARLALAQLGDTETVKERYLREREGWDLFYDLLDELEKGLAGGDCFAAEIQKGMLKLVQGWKVAG